MTTSGTQAQLEKLIPVDTNKAKYNFIAQWYRTRFCDIVSCEYLTTSNVHHMNNQTDHSISLWTDAELALLVPYHVLGGATMQHNYIQAGAYLGDKGTGQ